MTKNVISVKEQILAALDAAVREIGPVTKKARPCLSEGEKAQRAKARWEEKSLAMQAGQLDCRDTAVKATDQWDKAKLIYQALEEYRSGMFMQVNRFVAGLRRSGRLAVIKEDMAATLARLEVNELQDLLIACSDRRLNGRYHGGSLWQRKAEQTKEILRHEREMEREARRVAEEERAAKMAKAQAQRGKRKLPRGRKHGSITQGAYWAGVTAMAELHGSTQV